MKKLFLVIIVAIVLNVGCTSSTAGYNYESARLQFSQGKYKKAKEYIDKAIEAEVKQEYLILQGQIFKELGKDEDAIASYNRAISKETGKNTLENNKQAYKYMGLLYKENGEFDKASSNLDMAMKVDVLHEIDDELSLYKLDVLFDVKKYDEVITSASEFIKKYGDNENISHAYITMARSFGAKKDVENMNIWYSKALEKKDNSVYYYQARSYEQLGDYAKANECYDQYIKHSGSENKYEVYALQIDCLFKLLDKKNDDAIIKLLEEKINAGMVSEKEEHIKIFGKKYMSLLERKGMFEEAYVYAGEYLGQYPDDKDVKNEMKFLETRIISK